MLSPLGRGVSRVLSVLLMLGLGAGLAPAAVAKGKPVFPGTPTDLVVGTPTYDKGAFVVPATWKAGSNTTSFIATITGGGVTLASATLTTTSWSPRVAAPAGTVVTVTVYGYNGRQSKLPATGTATLPRDTTAPTGAFSATWQDPAGPVLPVVFTATSAPADDRTASAQIKVKVDFGDGSAPVENPTFPLTHDYAIEPGVARRFGPSITLADEAGNSGAAAVNAVVVFDFEAPTGESQVLTSAAWATWTNVTLRTQATDNLPGTRIKRTIAWGDGTTSTSYTDSVVQHVYATAGTFRPTVSYSDEAQPANVTDPEGAGTVVVSKDVYRPTVALTLPRARRSSVRSWRVLRGTAADGQTAVRGVRVKAVERRGAAYYAYVPAKGTWVKAGRKARALAKAGYLQASTSGAWSVRLPKLTKGVLLYRVEAIDAMGNVSAVSQHRQRLTRR